MVSGVSGGLNAIRTVRPRKHSRLIASDPIRVMSTWRITHTCALTLWARVNRLIERHRRPVERFRRRVTRVFVKRDPV